MPAALAASTSPGAAVVLSKGNNSAVVPNPGMAPKDEDGEEISKRSSHTILKFNFTFPSNLSYGSKQFVPNMDKNIFYTTKILINI